MNMIFSMTILLHGLLSLTATSSAARILAIFPIPAKSHFSYSEAIMKSLHEAGHHITFISPFPENPSENYTTINSRRQTFIYIGRSDIEELISLSLSSLLHLITEIEEKNCYDVIILKEIQEILHTTKKVYDIMFTEIGIMHECYLPIAEKLKIPVIGIVPLRSSKFSEKVIGYYNNPAIVPFELNDFGLEMSFSQRLMNLWSNIYMDYFYYTVISSKLKKFYEMYYSDSQQQKKKIAMTFYNNHASLLSRPLIPKAVEIGGIHIKPVTPLPQDLQKFIEEAEQGVILFTFGSVVNASSLPPQKRIVFVNAFASIPQRVIWKFEDSIEGISKNVLLSSWVPQRDILEHNNVKVFISHCGISGMYEAIYTGTPIVTIPLFADQQSNAAILKNLGVGISLDIHTVTTEKVLDALNTIINDSRYDERMKNLSTAFKDRPLTLQKSVIYWTEYVIKHNGISHLESVGSELPFYQYFMLDIFTFIAAFIIMALILIYYGGKKFYELISKCIKYSLPNGKKNN